MSASTNPALAACRCGDDPELQLLRDLMLRDIEYWDASLIAFGNPPRPEASAEVHSIWVRLEVRRLANKHRTQLGLPLLPYSLDAVCPPPITVTIVANIEKATSAFKRLGKASRRAADRFTLAIGAAR